MTEHANQNNGSATTLEGQSIGAAPVEKPMFKTWGDDITHSTPPEAQSSETGSAFGEKSWLLPKEPKISDILPASLFGSIAPPAATNDIDPWHEGEMKSQPTVTSQANKANIIAIDKRSGLQTNAREIGYVTSCNGSKIVIVTETTNPVLQNEDIWTVGQMISVKTSHARVVVMIREIKTEHSTWLDKEINAVIVNGDILGEVYEEEDGKLKFKRGVRQYPPMGSIAHRMRVGDLECIFDIGARKSVSVGKISQNDNIEALVAVEDILSRHVAFVGTTGVGKSCAVSLVVLRALEVEPDLRVLFLDPHNEFSAAFGDKANQLDSTNLDLPYWLLNFDELEDVIFRGRAIAEESDILREFVLNAKMDRIATVGGVQRKLDAHSVNVDTPVPYRLSEVAKQIDEMIGHLEPKFHRHHLRNLKVKIELIENNPRYGFMFGRAGREDNFGAIVSKIFRLPAQGKPLTTVNLAGLPNEVVNCVASVLARMSFEVARASDGAVKVLLVCEEAHRYVPSDPSLGFLPTRLAIARIAKEGRKYGCAVAVVTQRPGELDPTILSQCSTVFAMRLSNENDQEIVRVALGDSSSGVIAFLSALDNRECIAFGEGVPVPMRLRFADNDIGKSHKVESQPQADTKKADNIDLRTLVYAMRGVSEITSHTPHVQEAAPPTNNLAQSKLIKSGTLLANKSPTNSDNALPFSSMQQHNSSSKDVRSAPVQNQISAIAPNSNAKLREQIMGPKDESNRGKTWF